MYQYVTLLSGMVERDQSALLRPLSVFFGYIMNFFFEIACFFTEHNSLGIAIIFVTFVIRFLMLPLGLKSQRATQKMAALQPEINKIRSKYEGQKDRESQQKMAQEVQAVYAKNNANMFGGCLPMFIQMPIFFALNFVMRQSFLFINKLGDLYTEIALLFTTDGLIPGRYNLLKQLAEPRIPNGMTLDLSVPEDLCRIINKFTQDDWSIIMTSPQFMAADASVRTTLEELVQRKDSIEMFFGINLLENAGTAFPGILIPIFSALFMFLSSFLMGRRQKNPDPQQKTMQRFMTIFFPLLIGWTTISFPAGVGLYWTISSLFQLGQQLILEKFYHPDELASKKDSAKDKEIVKVIPPEKHYKKPRGS